MRYEGHNIYWDLTSNTIKIIPGTKTDELMLETVIIKDDLIYMFTCKPIENELELGSWFTTIVVNDCIEILNAAKTVALEDPQKRHTCLGTTIDSLLDK